MKYLKNNLWKLIGFTIFCFGILILTKLYFVQNNEKHKLELNYSILAYKKSKKQSQSIIQDLNKQQEIKNLQIEFSNSEIRALKQANNIIKKKYENEKKRYKNNDSILLFVSDSILSRNGFGKIQINK